MKQDKGKRSNQRQVRKGQKNKRALADLIVRFGEPPLRIQILTTISGVSFDDCFSRRAKVNFSGLRVKMIHLDDLKKTRLPADGPKTWTICKHWENNCTALEHI